MLLLLTLACFGSGEPAVVEPPSEPVKSPERIAAEAGALARASEGIDEVKTTFANRLHQATGSDGLEGAVKVCSEESQGMTALLGAETGARVGRSSLKLRNPNNAGPQWVQDYLKSQDGKVAVDVPGMSEVVGDTARVARAIPVEAACLGCHGERVDATVQPLLAERYPTDQATGYHEGELRGVVWAEVPVN